MRATTVMQLISHLEVGGAERLLVNFVKSCTETPKISQVVVVINGQVDRNLSKELDDSSIPTYYLSRPPGSKNPRYLLDLIKIIHKHRISVIHTHHRAAKYWAMLCRFVVPHIKLVHTLHSVKLGTLEAFNKNRSGFLHRSLHNALVARTIAISKAVADEARLLQIKRVEQIDNGVPISRFQSITPRPLEPPIQIISVGRLVPSHKGQDILIRAVKRCVSNGLDVECTFVGNPATGDPRALTYLESLASTLLVTDRVHFLLGRTDIAALLQTANLFVLPSRYEGFGLALVEAMAAGLPVIASNVDGPAYIVTNETSGLLFEPGSDEDLAEKITVLAQSPSTAQRLAENGRIRSDDFDISAMRERYIAIYSTLAIAR
jgi:glycosyltransferase involved in cell wall biosynthesis